MKALLPFVLLLVLSLSACAPSVYQKSLREQKNLTWKDYYAQKEDVFDAVLRQVQKGETSILTVDKELGIITTDWIEETSIRGQLLLGGQRKRTNYNVFESEQQGYTTVKVNLFVQQRSDDDNSWQEVPVTKRIAERHIPELFERIEEELAR